MGHPSWTGVDRDRVGCGPRGVTAVTMPIVTAHKATRHPRRWKGWHRISAEAAGHEYMLTYQHRAFSHASPSCRHCCRPTAPIFNRTSAGRIRRGERADRLHSPSVARLVIFIHNSRGLRTQSTCVPEWHIVPAPLQVYARMFAVRRLFFFSFSFSCPASSSHSGFGEIHMYAGRFPPDTSSAQGQAWDIREVLQPSVLQFWIYRHSNGQRP